MDNIGIIFDVDGTLWEASGSVAEAWTIEARRFGIEKTFTSLDMKGVMGLPMDELSAILLPELPLEKRHEVAVSCMDYELSYLKEHPGRLFPNEEETLRKLVSLGYRLYILSNAQHGYIESFLYGTGLEKYFSGWLCWGDNHLQKSDNMALLANDNALSSYCYVGDTLMDEKESRKAGVPFVHCAFGYGKALSPNREIARFEDLILAVSSIFPSSKKD